MFGTAKRHIQEFKTTADAQQRISYGRSGEGDYGRPGQDIPFIIGQFQCYLSVSQGMVLASPPQGVTCRGVKGHRKQLGNVQRKDGVVGTGIDERPPKNDRAAVRALHRQRNQRTPP